MKLQNSIYEQFNFTNDAEKEVHVSKWSPRHNDALKAAVLIAHGASEHIARYEDFANYLAGQGYMVYGNDHRGHGKTAGPLENLGSGGTDSWNGMVRDCNQLTEIIRQAHPELPLYIFGHSMGSSIARDYVQQYPEGVDGMILSGSFRILRYMENVNDFIQEAEQIMETQGPDVASESFGAILGRLNLDFSDQPGADWLSRDEKEVQKYANDPLCGFPFSVELMRDFCRGLEKIIIPAELEKTRRDLPVLLITGEEDPVHKYFQYIEELLIDYSSIGMQDVKSIVYSNARHEILNELERDKTYGDVLEWLNQKVETNQRKLTAISSS